MALFLVVDVKKQQFGSTSHHESSEATNTRHELRLRVRNLPLVAGAWLKHFSSEITFSKENTSAEQCANRKILPRALEPPTSFIWDLQERHVVPKARCIYPHSTTCSSDISLPVSSPFQRKHEMGDFCALQVSGRPSFPALPQISECTAQTENAFCSDVTWWDNG